MMRQDFFSPPKNQCNIAVCRYLYAAHIPLSLYVLGLFAMKVLVGLYSPFNSPIFRRRIMNATVSLYAAVPEALHDSLKNYLETHPDWDQDRVLTAALSLFLLQNGDSDRRAARVYLETLFHS